MPAMTKLEAVNEMLLAIGQAPVNTLEVAGIRDVSIASLLLDNVSRELQSDGHSFNTFTTTLTPDVSGKVVIPVDALRTDPVDPTVEAVPMIDESDDVLKLYDLTSESFTWADTVKVELVRLLPFEGLPQHARRYIVALAKLRFQASTVGSGILNDLIEQELGQAYAAFRRAELLQRDNNILDSGYTRISRNRHRNTRSY